MTRGTAGRAQVRAGRSSASVSVVAPSGGAYTSVIPVSLCPSVGVTPPAINGQQRAEPVM